MQWRDKPYDARYVVRRICAELGADPVLVWDILDEELGKEPGAVINQEEAAYLSGVVQSWQTELPAEKAREEETLLTVKQAAQLLKLGEGKLYEQCRTGKIAYIRYGTSGRIFLTRQAVEEYLTRHTHQALPQSCLRETYRKRRAL